VDLRQRRRSPGATVRRASCFHASIVSILETKQNLLAKTGLEDNYRQGFQDAAKALLAKRYYASPGVQTYPFILDAHGCVVLHPELPAGEEGLR
jgi:hypothetical protein